MYDKLFSPCKIGNCEIKNRIAMAPMLMGFGTFNGKATEKMLNYYEERAKGGTGLIFTEITRINDIHGAAAFAQLGASKDYHTDSIKELADRIHKHGAKLFVQLHHPGRQNMGLLVGTMPFCIFMDKIIGSAFGRVLYRLAPRLGRYLMEHDITLSTVAPSKCERSFFAESKVRALRKREIAKIVRQFADGAERVKNAGGDGVMLHATHGYLIQQFLSPNTNHRKDEYGGSTENRFRFLGEIIAAVRARCGDFPIVVRLTADECYDKIGKAGVGYGLDEGIKFAKLCESAGVDAIDVSSAAYDTFNYWLEPTSFPCGWRANMTKAIHDAVNIPVLGANLIRSPEQAEKQIEDGVQDFVTLGRPHIADPHWAEKVECGRSEDVKRCICCLYCIQSMQDNAYIGSHGKCSVNPLVGRENATLERNGNGRNVMIVGGGVAGLTAGEWLAKRGFRVTIYEKKDTLGGQINEAANPPHKEKIAWCVEDLETACRKLGVEIKLGTEVTKELIDEKGPYAVVFATGANSIKPRSIQGVSGKNVLLPKDVLCKEFNMTGKRFAVIGSGMTGLETAEKLCLDNEVTIVEMADEIAKGTWMQHVLDAMTTLKKHNVKFVVSEKLVSIGEAGITTKHVLTGKETNYQADYVVLSLGVSPENKLYKECEGRKNIYLIGDAVKSGRIADATEQGYLTAMKIN